MVAYIVQCPDIQYTADYSIENGHVPKIKIYFGNIFYVRFHDPHANEPVQSGELINHAAKSTEFVAKRAANSGSYPKSSEPSGICWFCVQIHSNSYNTYRREYRKYQHIPNSNLTSFADEIAYSKTNQNQCSNYNARSRACQQ